MLGGAARTGAKRKIRERVFIIGEGSQLQKKKGTRRRRLKGEETELPLPKGNFLKEG